jgi:nicotinate-nucleotide adenylyltransferase
MNIGIFGGTFDPPHNGHINLAEAVIEKTDIDRIIFILSAAPPHKPGLPISSFQHRMNMLQLAIEDIDIFSSSNIEYKRLPKLSYMFDTMLEFETIYKQDNLVLIIGEDSLDQLHLWHKGKKIAEKWKILTYPRKGDKVTLESLRENWTAKMSEKLLNTVVYMPFFPISATNIRERIISKENIKGLVKPEVLNYIIKNKLYSRELRKEI